MKNYFLGHTELAFIGGFIQAMNARIEFITALDVCWFARNPEYAVEVREGLAHLNNYLGYLRSRISAGFTVTVTTKMQVIDPTTKPPLQEPVSHTARVAEGGSTIWTKTVPATDNQPAAVRAEANAVRSQAARTQQDDVLAQVDEVASTWNAVAGSPLQQPCSRRCFLASETRIAAQPALALDVALPDLDAVAPGDALNLPLREVAMQVLDTAEFQQRNARLDDRAVSFWFEKALGRKPTDQEAATLDGVLRLFGHKSFFRALAYSTEYESRWAAGVPTDRAVA